MHTSYGFVLFSFLFFERVVMKRSRIVWFAMTMLIGLVTSIGFATDSDWWHGLSQSSRDSIILSKALSHVGENTGLQCKEWVRDVVKEASQNSVTIPATKPNKYQWYSHPYVYGIPQPSPVTWATPGSIIQMKWVAPNGNVTPHTAIVKSHTSSGMNWIDCNWDSDTKVKVHFVSYSSFANAVGSSYTIYFIK